MDTATVDLQKNLADLERAEQAFHRVLGKHDMEKALEVLVELELANPAVEDFVLSRIEQAFALDSFAGMLRFDAISMRLMVDSIRLQVEIVHTMTADPLPV